MRKRHERSVPCAGGDWRTPPGHNDDRGLYADHMGELVGAPTGQVIDWLVGRFPPSRRAMNRLASRAGVPLAWIDDGDEADLLPGTATRRRWRPMICGPAAAQLMEVPFNR